MCIFQWKAAPSVSVKHKSVQPSVVRVLWQVLVTEMAVLRLRKISAVLRFLRKDLYMTDSVTVWLLLILVKAATVLHRQYLVFP